MPPQTTLDALQVGRRSYIHTPEHRAKMSASMSARYEDGTLDMAAIVAPLNKKARERARLSDDQVREARYLKFIDGVSGYAIAKRYGVRQGLILDILRSKTYRNVQGICPIGFST
jgi:hypothetical protein